MARQRGVSALAKKVALLCASVALCLLVLECAVRLFTDVVPPVLVRHPVVGKTYRPGFEGDVFVPEAGREVRLRFNSDGFRGPDLAREKPPGVARIALIGDSFVVAVALDEERTAAVQLERLRNASDPGRRWQVQNWGVSSSSTGQELVLYREVVAHYDPDVVICAYSTRNDFSDNSSRMTSQSRIRFALDERGELVFEPPSAGRSAATRWLQLHSRLYIWQKQATDVLKHRAQEAASPLDTGSAIYRTDETEELGLTWALNERLVQAFAEAVEARGGRFVLALLPDANAVYDDLWESVLERAGDSRDRFDREHPERRLTAVAREHGFDVVPMLAEFRRATGGRRLADTDRASWLFLNGTDHFNEAGSLLVARILDRFLSGAPPGGGPAPTPGSSR